MLLNLLLNEENGSGPDPFRKPLSELGVTETISGPDHWTGLLDRTDLFSFTKE